MIGSLSASTRTMSHLEILGEREGIVVWSGVCGRSGVIRMVGGAWFGRRVCG